MGKEREGDKRGGQGKGSGGTRTRSFFIFYSRFISPGRIYRKETAARNENAFLHFVQPSLMICDEDDEDTIVVAFVDSRKYRSIISRDLIDEADGVPAEIPANSSFRDGDFVVGDNLR